MKNSSIFKKLFLSHTVIGFSVVVVFSFIFYFILRDALIQRTIDQLSSINILKKTQIDSYFLRTQKDMEVLLRDDLSLNNLIPRGALNASAHFSDRLQQEMNSIRYHFSFERVDVVVRDGDRLFSDAADSLLLISMVTSRSIPGKSFTIVDASTELKTVLYYILSKPSEGRTVYIVIRDDFQKIQRILQETTGMGMTGESYVVGNDFKMRSLSRFFPAIPPLSITVKTGATLSSSANNDNRHILKDYRGEKVLSYYRTLDIPDVHWTLISEIDYREAMKPVHHLRDYLILIMLVIIAVIVVITIFISNAISTPILFLKDIIISLSKGIIPTQRPVVSNKDEIGQIAHAIDQLIGGLTRTTHFANEIGSGNFKASFDLLSGHDALGLALVHMRDKLKDLNEREIKLVREKTAALLEGQENERKRIIQELHDGVGQLLTAIRLRVEMLDSDAVLRREIMNLINDTIAEVKRISYNVMPNAIIDFGLEAALRGLCENTRKYTALEFDFRYVKEVNHMLNFEITIAVFRMVQEGLNNIIKHAHAQHIAIHVLDKADEIYVIIKDDGQGFDEKSLLSKNGFGLRSIHERAKLLNGSVEIHSKPNEGTAVEVHIPIVETDE